MHSLSRHAAFQVARAVEILERGGIIAFPTDTVYGLGGDAFSMVAAERVYEAKQRPRHLPLPVLVADTEQLAAVADSVSKVAQRLMGQFWPGGLTLVLPKASSLPDSITAGGNKVAVRIPDHVIPLTIIRRFGRPIVGTSANVSDGPSPVTAEEVGLQLGSDVDFTVDAGRSPAGVESTVVDVAGETPVVLRWGLVPEDEVKRLCQEHAKEVYRSAHRSGL